MEKSSFRDILKQMLQAEEAALASENKTESASPAFQSVPPPLFTFEAPPAKFSSQSAYRQNKVRPAPAKKADTPEVLIPFEKLNAADQSDTQLLIVLGADFKSGISNLRLKKEHRRLAKQLHPDRLSDTLSQTEKDLRREKFLILQAAYERLNRSLSAIAKSSGNESASASNSPHRDAA